MEEENTIDGKMEERKSTFKKSIKQIYLSTTLSGIPKTGAESRRILCEAKKEAKRRDYNKKEDEDSGST